MKKIIVLAATIIAAALMSGCTNYKKMAQDDPVDYLTIAAQNTFKAVSEKNILDITSQAYNAINSGTVTVAFNSDSINASCSAISADKNQKGYTMDISNGDTFINGKMYLGNDSFAFSIKNDDDSYEYIVPFDKFENRFRNSIWASDSNSRYSLTSSDEDAIINYVEQLQDSMNKKGELNTIKQLKKLKSEFEETDVTASDGTYPAYVITYNLSDEELIELVENIGDNSIDNDSYKEMADTIKRYEISLKLSFEVNKKTNTLISVSGKLKGNDSTTVTLKLDFGGKPDSVDEYSFKLNASDEYDSYTISGSFLTESDSKTSETYTLKLKYHDDYDDIDLKCKTEYDKKSHEFSSKFTVFSGSESVDAKLSGKIETSKKASSIIIDNIGGDLKDTIDEVLDNAGEYRISLTFSEKAELEKLNKGEDLLDISEQDLSDMMDSVNDSFENLFESSDYAKETKRSEANANAKQIHTASSATLTLLGIASFDFGYSYGDAFLTFNGVTDGMIHVTWGNVDYAPSDETCDMAAYLGEDYSGYAYAVFDPNTYAVKYSLWSEEPIPDKYMHQLTEDEIIQSQKEGSVVGCYPVLH